eukprot:5052039-Amphidinium_carterae.2
MLREDLQHPKWKVEEKRELMSALGVPTRIVRAVCTLECTGQGDISSERLIAHGGHLLSAGMSRGDSAESCGTWASSNSHHTGRGATQIFTDMKQTVSERFSYAGSS